MKIVPISGQFFTLFASADELHCHLKTQQIELESTEHPKTFPCLAEFHLDEHEKPYPVFFTAKDVQTMASLIECSVTS